MKYRTLGKTGYKVSEIGFGSWQIGGAHWGKQADDVSEAALNLAIDKGVNLIDTAAVYARSEEVVAKVLKQRSETVFITTKIFTLMKSHPSPYHTIEESFPEKYLVEKTEERLKRLEVDKLDILLLHSWSRAWNNDPKPIEVLQKLKEQGLVEYIGISAPPNDQNSILEPIKQDVLDVVEFAFNIFTQEAAAELLPSAKEHNVGVIARSPFDEGALTGKYSADTEFEEEDFRRRYFGGDRLARSIERVERLEEDIADSGLGLVQASLLFSLAQDAVGTVIPGMRYPQYVEANTAVSDMEPLSQDIIEKLKEHNWIRSSWSFR